MQFMMDITGEDTQPKVNYAAYNAIFLIAFVFVGAIFMLKLFVAVIVDTYSQAFSSVQGSGPKRLGDAADTGGEKFMGRTEEQAIHMNLERLIDLTMPMPLPERPTHNTFRLICYDVCIYWDRHEPFKYGGQATLHHIRSNFDNVMLACIAMNLGFMLTKNTGQSDGWESIIFYQDIIFLSIFGLELVLKCCALMPQAYLADSWMCFDAVVVAGAIIILPFSSSGGIGSVLQRVFRAGRVVRLVNHSEKLKLVASTLGSAAYGVGHILSLIFIIMLSYGVLGVHLFGEAKFGAVLNRHNNFSNLVNALQALTRALLGEWVLLRHDCQVQPPECTAGLDCGSSWSALYFFTFALLVQYIILNLIVAVIMEHFVWLFSMERTAVNQDDLHISTDDVRAFQQEWERLDPLNRGSIPISDVKVLCERLSPPLGKLKPDKAWIKNIQQDLPTVPGALRGRARFKELFLVLSSISEKAAQAERALVEPAEEVAFEIPEGFSLGDDLPSPKYTAAEQALMDPEEKYAVKEDVELDEFNKGSRPVSGGDVETGILNGAIPGMGDDVANSVLAVDTGSGPEQPVEEVVTAAGVFASSSVPATSTQ